jgi:putative serine/threonine protein kinase
MGRERVALKIRRMDADRQGLLPEAELLAKANSAGVGPKLISVSTNFLLMQLVESELLPAWLETNKEKTVVRNVLTELLEQCRRLDTVGLDHGELSHAPKHVIVDGQTPFIVDFETASINRKPANVTAICQYLFMNSGAVAKMVAEVFGERNRERIVEALRGYKRCRTRRDFELVLKSCLS